jgi:hypothetical protein
LALESGDGDVGADRPPLYRPQQAANRDQGHVAGGGAAPLAPQAEQVLFDVSFGDLIRGLPDNAKEAPGGSAIDRHGVGGKSPQLHEPAHPRDGIIALLDL